MRQLLAALGVLGLLLTFGHSQNVHADQSAETTVKNSGEDAKASAKKTVRKVKRTTRKAMGTDTFGKDVKDSANDMGDDAVKNKNKMKNEMKDSH